MRTGPTNIVSERFELRPLVRGDASALFGTLSDEAHCRYLSRGAFATEDELADWLTDPHWNGRSWVAIDRADGTIVGRFVAVPTRDAGVLELGYITVWPRQGQGIARECMAALIDHLFARENYRRLFVEIDAENTPSIALAERLGFTLEGCLREHERTHKGLCNLLIYGLLSGEWPVRER